MIGGNITAVIQQKSGASFNEIGEKVHEWVDVQTLWGWLDMSGGDYKYTYNAKLQESTHIFICDYVEIDRNAGNKRMMVHDTAFDIVYIDDPMELHQHLEIYLRYVGR